MAKKQWFSGPPPSLGWWPASIFKNENTFRWWNGKQWSVAVTKQHTAYAASYRARMLSEVTSIRWKHRPDDWPERSRT